jgi:toxin ParE1/3/4
VSLRVAIRPAALLDISEQHAHIAADNPRAAKDFLEAVHDILDKLAEYPDIGRECVFRSASLKSMRQIPVVGYQTHLLFYRAIENNLVLERVLHAARDIPGILDDAQ